MRRRIVVTGVGAVHPDGNDVTAIKSNVIQKLLGQESKNNTTASSVIRTLSDFDGAKYINNRLRRKIDEFSVYGIVAVEMALKASRLNVDKLDPNRVGIYVGNCFGGWQHIEDEVKALHIEGIKGMGPYVATAWFPAALQGQLSLLYGFSAQSKTFSTSDVAGMQAIGYAAEAISNGVAEVMLCGASEHLSSPLVKNLLEKASTQQHSEVFGEKRPGDFSEGAAFLVLEERQHALERGASILCELTGFVDYFAPDKNTRNNTLEYTAELFNHNENAVFIMDGIYDDEKEITSKAFSNKEIKTSFINLRPYLNNQFSVSGVIDSVLASSFLSENNGDGEQQSNKLNEFSNTNQIIIQRLSNQGHVCALSFSTI
ncbi:beta-ketoacyl synthase N-terminal-like domain-containing protein [Photorhabdus namnaonensis]|uniref:3-oxoacyl-[acyl-carrier-protein] synthase 2 n=1 Tax=Photorhabdus namnaonensis TaxID=1851568 RepID=A0A1B8YDK9_9GAMM|nr:beta-ketoacyl synthase N-terminal-like domain-containing protein [Photorhabdus namnaonensis]OCA53216.1 3-oxoacyl-[acyl-carrier-protein] synthase 2 [Photorhabdus namnaonensis]